MLASAPFKEKGHQHHHGSVRIELMVSYYQGDILSSHTVKPYDTLTPA